MCAPDVPAPNYINPNESVDSQLQAYLKNLGPLTQATAANLPVLDRAQLALAQETAPGWAELQKNLALSQGVPLAENAARSEAAANAIKSQSDADILGTTGLSYARLADALQREVDPEYYATRAAAGRQAQDLLGSYSLNGLSPTEENEAIKSITRSNLATGTYGLPSQINTLNNAMQYGSAFDRKRQNLAGAIGTAAGAMPAFRSGIDVSQAALGRPSMATGLANSQFAGVNQPSFGGAGLNQGNMLFGGINNTFGNAMNANANVYGTFANNASYSPFDQGLKGANTLGKFAGGMAMCSVAREVFGPLNKDWYLFYLWKESESPAWFRSLYNKYHLAIARFIKNKPVLKKLIKNWMTSKL